MGIYYTKKFEKRLKKLSEKERIAFYERLEIFIVNKNEKTLNCHYLYGKYSIFQSINIKGDLRALFEEVDGDFYFHLVGNHNNLYK